ncbi:hypothetical protein [Devosia sp.]|uniref:hypothetical protein n=1 Tax=Devosia sp. TaxID=1871048 RepID=UPI001AD2C4E7|nr:hypothetical protein [Devosia sp.]MBN9307962.1 hypothetical protein [Devosia sp.]
MQIKTVVAAVGLAPVALPLAVLASQPRLPVRPSLDTAKVLSLLVLDPYAETDMKVRLPQGYATLDVDGDPFGG